MSENLNFTNISNESIIPNDILIESWLMPVIITVAIIIFGYLIYRYTSNKKNNKPKVLSLSVKNKIIYLNGSVVEPKIKINIQNSSNKEKTYSIAMKGDILVLGKMRISNNVIQVPQYNTSSVTLIVDNSSEGNVSIIIRNVK